MVSREILSNNANNLFALEVSCIALQNLGLKQQSLNEYESLYLKTDREDVLYTIAFLHVTALSWQNGYISTYTYVCVTSRFVFSAIIKFIFKYLTWSDLFEVQMYK